MVANVSLGIPPIDAMKPANAPDGTDTARTRGKATPVSGKPAPAPVAFERSVEQLAEFLSTNARGLRFRVDSGSGRTVVTVVNPNNGEVIRQIPSEEFLHLANALRRHGTVHFVDDQA